MNTSIHSIEKENQPPESEHCYTNKGNGIYRSMPQLLECAQCNCRTKVQEPSEVQACPNCGTPLNSAKIIEEPQPEHPQSDSKQYLKIAFADGMESETETLQAFSPKDDKAHERLAKDETEGILTAVKPEDESAVRRQSLSARLGAGGKDIDGNVLPRRLGNYQLLEIVGRGGMGVVYRARQIDIGRIVALKLIYSKSGAPKTQDALGFVAEAQITGQIEHPNIVPVHDMGTDEKGRPYFVMKYVYGRSLSRILRDLRKGRPDVKKEFSRRRLLELFISTAQAVGFAHARGVIHRDLKPANIMIGEFGEVLLMDWGLAKAFPENHTPPSRADSGRHSPLEEGVWDPVSKTYLEPIKVNPQHHERVRTVLENRDDQLAKAGMVAGTPEYMAPEQAAGEPSAFLPKADIYGLGAILFEILTLNPPHQDEDTRQLMRKVVLDPIQFPDASGRKNKVPPSLEAIALKALAKKPEERYISVSSLIRDVKAYLDDRPVLALPDNFGHKVVRALRKNAGKTITIAIILAVVGIGTTIVVQIENASNQKELKLTKDSEEAARKAEKEAKDAAKANAEKLKAVNEKIKAIEEKTNFEKEVVDAARRRQAAMKPYQNGLEFLTRRQTKLAIQNLESAVSIDPSNPLPHMVLGRAFARLRTPEAGKKSIDAYLKAADLFQKEAKDSQKEPDKEQVARAYIRAGDVASQLLKNLKLTRQYYNQAAKLDPNSPVSLTSQAYLKMMDHDGPAALKLVESAIQKADWLWEAQLVAGGLYAGLFVPDSGLRDLPKAIQYLNRAVDLAPDEPQILAARAQTLEGLDKHSQALDDYDELIRLQKHNVLILLKRSSVLLKLNKIREAYRDLNKSVSLEPQNHLLRKKRGDFILSHFSQENMRKENELKIAEDDFSELIRLEPKNADAYLSRAKIRMIQKNFRDAVSDAETAKRLNPDKEDGVLIRALAYVETGNLPSAAENFRIYLRKNPNDDPIRKQYGIILLRIGNEEKALDAFEAYTDQIPNDLEVLIYISQIRRTPDKNAPWRSPKLAVEAAKRADKAAKSKQDKLKAKFELAEALWDAEQKDEAIKILDHIDPLAPFHPRLLDLRNKFQSQ